MRHERARTTVPILIAIAAGALPASAQQDLHSNGPIITHPGMGFGGADVSVLQTALSGSAYGFSCQQFVGYRLADDFTVPAGGWTVSGVVFFEFQANAPIGTATINSTNLRLWRGRPDDAGSVVVFGNTTANRWVSSTPAHLFRTPDTSLSNTQREVFRVEAAISPPVVLAPGTYWLDWQSGGTLSSGPFDVPVTVLGSTGPAGANARFFDGTSWSNVRDLGMGAAQEMSFIIRGTAGSSQPCYPNCDGSTATPVLNVNDFICFQQRFAAGETYANCDGSTTIPVLNVNDFICYQQRFAAGCSAP